MKRIFLSIVLGLVLASMAQAQNAQYLAYIENWKQEALRQQMDYGIPASISMAQGLLESGAGQSELAREANNHFGIKCTTDWLGATYRHDDETKNECFRSYADAADSWRDHSLFLLRSRYAVLFEYEVTDYVRWANGLKECGYATDPSYPKKLIHLIEEYRLDTIGQTVVTVVDESEGEKRTTTTTTVMSTQADRVTKEDVRYSEGAADTKPKSAYKERRGFYSQHPRQRMNRHRYVVAREGDTYANVAFRLNMRERTLRKMNDALGRDLQPGDRIYLYWKPLMGVKEHAVLWVHPGEEVWMVAQREGIKLSYLYWLNKIPRDVKVFQTRQKILLRPEKKQK